MKQSLRPHVFFVFCFWVDQVTHIVAVTVGASLGLVDQRGLDVGQVSLLLRVAELGEDLLLVRLPLVLERDHFVRGAQLRVPTA